MPDLKEHRTPIIMTSLFVVIAIASHIFLSRLPKQEGVMAEIGHAAQSFFIAAKDATSELEVVSHPVK